MKMNTTLKTKALSILIVMVMLFSVLPIAAFASGGSEIYVGGVVMADGTYLANDANETTTTAPETGGYAYYKDGTLTLNNYEYEGEGYVYDTYSYYTSVIYSPVALEIVLDGQNSIVNTGSDSDGITPEAALTISGDGSLDIDAEYGIYSYSGDITINSGNIDISSYEGIYSYVGDFTIAGGRIVIVGEYDGIFLDEGDFTIEGGILDITSQYGITSDKGSVSFNGGTTTINSREGEEVVSAAGGIAFTNVGLLYPTGAKISEDGNNIEDTLGNTDICVIIGESGTPIPEIYVGGVGMADGTYLANGANETTTTAPETGGYAYYKDSTLTLNNYEYEGEGYVYDTYSYYTSVIYSPVALEIVLDGQNSIVNTGSDSDGITPEADLTISGDGSLDIDAEYGIYSYGGDITINSGRIVIAGEDNGIFLGKGDFTIEGGILDITSKYGITGDEGSVSFNGGTTFVDASEEEGVTVSALNGITLEEDVEILEPENAEKGTDDSNFSVIYGPDGNKNICVVIGVRGSAFTVTASSNYTECEVDGGGNYETGSTATLIATADESTQFEYWLDADIAANWNDVPTEAQLREAIVSYDARYMFTVTKNVNLRAVFSVSNAISVIPMSIEGTDESSLLKATELEYDVAPITLGAGQTTLPGEVIPEFITVGEQKYRFAGFIIYGYDDETDTQTLNFKETLDMPIYDSAEYWDWITAISDGLYAAYTEYTPVVPQNPIVPDDPDFTKTGDSSNIWLWFALLFISGGAMLGTVLYGKKRKIKEN